jgi:hypothetical protein
MLMGENIHTTSENTKALAIASKEIGLEVNAEKTRYVVMSRDQNAGKCSKIKTGNKFFETVEHFKYLGATPTNKVPFMKNLRADCSPRMLALFR